MLRLTDESGVCGTMTAFDKAWKVVKSEPEPQLGERILIDADYRMEDAKSDEKEGYGKIHRMPNGEYEFVGHHPNPGSE